MSDRPSQGLPHGASPKAPIESRSAIGWPLVAMVACLATSGLLLASSGTPARVIGYLLGCWMLAVLAVAHRARVLRLRSTGYVVTAGSSWVGAMVVLLLLAGFVVGTWHALLLFSADRVAA